jgi:hypothetical protein
MQSRISYGDLDKNVKHSPWSHRVYEELNRVQDTIMFRNEHLSGIIAIMIYLMKVWFTFCSPCGPLIYLTYISRGMYCSIVYSAGEHGTV